MRFASLGCRVVPKEFILGRSGFGSSYGGIVRFWVPLILEVPCRFIVYTWGFKALQYHNFRFNVHAIKLHRAFGRVVRQLEDQESWSPMPRNWQSRGPRVSGSVRVARQPVFRDYMTLRGGLRSLYHVGMVLEHGIW